MTDDPTPNPAAVKVAAEAIARYVSDSEDAISTAVVAALADAYDLCPPSTLARVEALEAVAEAARDALDVDPTTAQGAERHMRLEAALDAATAGTTGKCVCGHDVDEHNEEGCGHLDDDEYCPCVDYATAGTTAEGESEGRVNLCVECGVNPVATPGGTCADCQRN